MKYQQVSFELFYHLTLSYMGSDTIHLYRGEGIENPSPPLILFSAILEQNIYTHYTYTSRRSVKG